MMLYQLLYLIQLSSSPHSTLTGSYSVVDGGASASFSLTTESPVDFTSRPRFDQRGDLSIENDTHLHRVEPFPNSTPTMPWLMKAEPDTRLERGVDVKVPLIGSVAKHQTE